MSSGVEKRNPFQLINDHIKSLEQDLNKLDDKEKLIDTLRKSAQDDIYRKYDSLVNAIKESHVRTAKQLDDLCQQKKQELEETRQRLIERKTKAETELIVDHKPVEMPDVSLDYTVNIENASHAIFLIKLSVECGKTIFTLPKKEIKTESGAVGGFSFSSPSKSSASDVTPTFTSLSTAFAIPPQSTEATPKRKKKQSATEAGSQRKKKQSATATARSPSLRSPSSTPKMTIRNLRDFIQCSNCRKPRCVYSGKKLSKDDQKCWSSLKCILPYRCGENPLPSVIMAVEKSDCSKEVSNQYFSHESKFPAVCYHCGINISSSSRSNNEMGEADVIVYEVCPTCKARGIEPRTRKKLPIKKANTDKQSKSNLFF